jgi:hypothetical protein
MTAPQAKAEAAALAARTPKAIVEALEEPVSMLSGEVAFGDGFFDRVADGLEAGRVDGRQHVGHIGARLIGQVGQAFTGTKLGLQLLGGKAKRLGGSGQAGFAAQAAQALAGEAITKALNPATTSTAAIAATPIGRRIVDMVFPPG